MIKSKFIFYSRIYLKILTQDLKSKMSYRADFIISLLGMIFMNLSGLIVFWIMFQNFDNINGWTFYEILFLYGFSLMALTPMQCFFDNNWNLRTYVYNGDFVKYCFRPMNLYFYYISEVFDPKGLGEFAMGLGLLIYSWCHIGVPLSFINIILLIITFFSASLIMISIMNLAAATCFWVMNSGYIMVTMFKFTEYTKYPVSIFNGLFKFIFTFIIPIGFVAYYPSLFFLRPDSIHILSFFTPVIGIVFFILSYKVWMLGATRYSGTGS